MTETCNTYTFIWLTVTSAVEKYFHCNNDLHILSRATVVSEIEQKQNISWTFSWSFRSLFVCFFKKRRSIDLFPVSNGNREREEKKISGLCWVCVWLSGGWTRRLPHLFGICWSHWFSSPVPLNVHHTGIPGEERKQAATAATPPLTRPLRFSFSFFVIMISPRSGLVHNERWKLIWRCRLIREVSVPQGSSFSSSTSVSKMLECPKKRFLLLLIESDHIYWLKHTLNSYKENQQRQDKKTRRKGERSVNILNANGRQHKVSISK